MSSEFKRASSIASIAAATAPHVPSEHKTIPVSSWLFIRDQESIWIERPYGFSVVVAGPGLVRAHLVFPNDAALQAYQVETAERLTRDGWFLWGFDRERRMRSDPGAAPRAYRGTTSIDRKALRDLDD